MKTRLLFLPLLCVAVLRLEATITLPLEVLGEPGHVETVILPLPSGAASVTGLKLKVHALTYANKASVRINDSDWISLNNSSVVLPPLEKGYWGMGGTLSTLRMTLPVSSRWVKNGENTVQFRFNDLDGKTIGYRVLALNFVAGESELVPASEFAQDDPREWKPPLDNPEAIAGGKALWYTAPLKEGPKDMRVFCTDCHAQDGRDLKYFNYSNKSIVERSIFHKLNRHDSEKIASYIRSLDVPYEEKGRPWNPPYQPAPGMDARPVRSWAAGAGLEAVLDNDGQTLAYLFPDGPKAGAIDFKRTLNAREIPLAVQLPDWNHWLPPIHPNDAYPNVFPDQAFVRFYGTLRERLAGKSGAEAGKFFNSQKSAWDRTGASTGLVKPARGTPAAADYAYRNKGMAHWRAVKTWEMMTEFQMEDVGQAVFGSADNNRRWFHGEIFRLSPHMLQQPLFDGFYSESMQWYQLQMVLNDGNRRNGSIVPIDWGYQHALNFSAWNNPAGMTTYAIAVLNMIKGGEVVENEIRLGAPNGWNPFKENTFWLAPGNHLKNRFDTIDPGLRRRVAEALVTPWIEKAESYSREEYVSAGLLTEAFRHLTYESALNLARLGIDPGLVSRMAEFGKEMWPEANWESLSASNVAAASTREFAGRGKNGGNRKRQK